MKKPNPKELYVDMILLYIIFLKWIIGCQGLGSEVRRRWVWL